MALFERHRRLHKRHLFDDLPFEAQLEAQQRLWRYCKRWEGDLPGWRLAILIGQARRWTMTSEEERSQWGRSMRAKKGGYAVQRKYRMQNRTGEKHPAHKAARVSATRRRWRKMDREEEQRRITLGLLPKARCKLLPIG